MSYITPKKYAELSETEKWLYSPEHKEYITKKRRDYDECDSCGHTRYLGWVEYKTPIGEPYRYRELTGLGRYWAQTLQQRSTFDPAEDGNGKIIYWNRRTK